MLYIGIDPGNTGAVAFIFEDEHTFEERIEIVDAPTMTVQDGKKKRTMLVPQAMAEIIAKRVPDRNPAVTWKWGRVFAVVEKVGTMPEQGISSAFNFGTGYGMWQGILAALWVPFELVHPRRWQTEMMKDSGKGKDANRLMASRLYPSVHQMFSRVKDDGRADAMLLAAYAQRTHGSAKVRQQPEQPSLLGTANSL